MKTIRFAGLALVLVAVLSMSASTTDSSSSSSHQPLDVSSPPEHSDPVLPVLFAMTLMLAAAKAGGELFERLKLPSVLGELIGGVVLGNLILVFPSWTFFEPIRTEHLTEHWAVVIDSIARIGVILLLFEVGLETTVAEMRKVGASSFIVAIAGVVVPFLLGYGVSALLIREVPAFLQSTYPHVELWHIHMFIGATLCATSVGITARVFKDLGKMHLPEAKIILGAAVIDDVLGLLVLTLVASIVAGAESGVSLSIGSFLQITGIAIGFLAGSIVIGSFIVPRLFSTAARMRTSGIMIVSSVLFCFALSYLASVAGLAPIVGAFAAGLILEDVHLKRFNEERSLHEWLRPVTTLLVPIFFVLMGIQVHLDTFAEPSVLWIALGLTVAAFIGKQVCGLVVLERGLDRLSIGLGMIPRGEVGLIFASIGKELNVIDNAVFSAIVIMVILTTFVTPPFLQLSLNRVRKPNRT